MSVKQKKTEGLFFADRTKWGLVGAVFLGAMAAHLYWGHQLAAWLLLGWSLVALVMLLLAWQTTQGQQFRGFMQAAQVEMLKVVWPTRQETIQTALVVIVVVAVSGVALWGIDSLLLRVMGQITGHGV